VAPVHKVADEVRMTIIFTSFGLKERNEPVVISNKLTNNCVSLVTTDLRLDVARRPCVGPR
jgi:hypothetical protein